MPDMTGENSMAAAMKACIDFVFKSRVISQTLRRFVICCYHEPEVCLWTAQALRNVAEHLCLMETEVVNER